MLNQGRMYIPLTSPCIHLKLTSPTNYVIVAFFDILCNQVCWLEGLIREDLYNIVGQRWAISSLDIGIWVLEVGCSMRSSLEMSRKSMIGECLQLHKLRCMKEGIKRNPLRPTFSSIERGFTFSNAILRTNKKHLICYQLLRLFLHIKIYILMYSFIYIYTYLYIYS